jgi:hypothetical protein
MKHFFFLDQSEFLNQFFDNAHIELKKPASAASMTKIQSLLYMAVSNPGSASSLDPHKEQLRAVLSTTRLYDWLLTVVSKRAGEGILAAMKGPPENKVDETKEKEKEITSMSTAIASGSLLHKLTCPRLCSGRGLIVRLRRPVPLVPRHLSQSHHAVPADLPLPIEPPIPRIFAHQLVDRTQEFDLAKVHRIARHGTVEATYLCAACPDAAMGATHAWVRYGRRPRDPVEKAGGQVVKGVDHRSTASGSHRVPGHLSERVYLDVTQVDFGECF